MSKRPIRLTASEIATVNFYDEIALRSIGVKSEKGFWSGQMDQFQGYLGKGRILDVGCGAGRDVGALVQRGFDCVGVDPSEGMLLHARVNYPSCDFRCMHMYDLHDFPDGIFDGFWSSASIHHIQKSRVDAALSEIRRVTSPGGIGFVAVREGDGELRGSRVPDCRLRYFALYRRDELASKMASNGFEILGGDSKSRGDFVSYLYLFVRKI